MAINILDMKNQQEPIFLPGQVVEVNHLQGKEHGTIESINYKTGKVLIYFDYEACPHFDSFNINQIRAISPKLVRSNQRLDPKE